MRKQKYLLLLSAFLIDVVFQSCKNPSLPKEEVTADKKDLVSELTEKIGGDSLNAKLYFDRAMVYAAKSMTDLAFADMEKVLKLDSTKPGYLMQYADLAFKVNKVRASRDALEKIRIIQPDNFDAAFRLAELYLYSNNQDMSIKYLDSVLQHDPKNTKALLMKGFNLKEKHDTVSAIQSFRTAIEADPKFYEAQMQMAILYHAQNNTLAVEYYKNTLSLQPKSEEAMYGLAMWYQEHDNFNKAIEGYTEMTKLFPKNKNAYFNLGYLHQIQLKVYDEAIKYYSQAITADSQYAQAYYNRALCFEFLGNIAAAKDDFSKALNLRNNNYPMAKEGLDRVSK